MKEDLIPKGCDIMIKKYYTELLNHIIRVCPACLNGIDFAGFIASQSKYALNKSHFVLYYGITEEDYKKFEKLWQDKRVKLLCCRCYEQAKDNPEYIKILMDTLKLRYARYGKK